MSESQIYIVAAGCEYEGKFPVTAFYSEDCAKAFSAECEKHIESYPHCPDMDDDKKWGKFNKKLEKWRKKTPGGVSLSEEDSMAVYALTIN